MSEDTKETTFGNPVESDSELGKTRVSSKEAMSIFHDSDNKIDDKSTITLGHTESGEWVVLDKPSDVREATKADALEAVADEIRKNQD